VGKKPERGSKKKKEREGRRLEGGGFLYRGYSLGRSSKVSGTFFPKGVCLKGKGVLFGEHGGNLILVTKPLEK